MTTTDTRTPARQNHDWLVGMFMELLAQQQPESVLDVGCGAGQLMRLCGERGISVRGLDQPGPRLDELRTAGLDVREGTAVDLPFEDASVDWITMRHVPHHLEDPARAFAEALRVSRTGLLLAEPWSDACVAAQRGWLAVDRWEKRLDRAGGMFHADVLDLNALLSFLPPDLADHYEIESHRHLRLRNRSVDGFEQRARERISELPDADTEHDILITLIAEVTDLGLSWNGSLCVLLRRV